MASLRCFMQLQPMVSVQFEWFQAGVTGANGVIVPSGHALKQECPYVGIGDVVPGQLDVGKKVTIILQNGKEDAFYVCGIRFCVETLRSPVILLIPAVDRNRDSDFGRGRGSSTYSFTVVLPGVECSSNGGLKRTYAQIEDRAGRPMNLHSGAYGKCGFSTLRSFKHDVFADIDFPLGGGLPAAAASSSSMAPETRRQQLQQQLQQLGQLEQQEIASRLSAAQQLQQIGQEEHRITAEEQADMVIRQWLSSLLKESQPSE